MKVRIVEEVVRGGRPDDSRLPEKRSDGIPVFGEEGVATVPDQCRILPVRDKVQAEETLEFQAGPVEERIPDEGGKDAAPGIEFLPRGRVPRNQAFIEPHKAHRPVLVRIRADPEGTDVRILPVPAEIPDREMVVEIDDRTRFGGAGVEFPRELAFKQKRFSDKRHGQRFEEEERVRSRSRTAPAMQTAPARKL